MDESFDLLSSMSPKIRGRQQTIKTNHVSRLALRKHFRRSRAFDKSNSFRNEDLAIVEVTTESSDSVSSFRESKMRLKDSNDIIIIDSDSDDNLRAKNLPQDQEPKNTRIQQWVNDIGDDKKAETFYSQVSTIFGDETPKIDSKIAACSSFNDNNLNHRFDELFINKKKQCHQLDQSSAFSSCVNVVEDSFEKNKSLDYTKKKVQIDKSSFVASPFSLNLDLLDSSGKNETPDDIIINDNRQKSAQIYEPSVQSPFSLHLGLLDSLEKNRTDDNPITGKKTNHEPSVESPFSLHLGLLDSLKINKTPDDNIINDKKKINVQINEPSVESPFSLHLGLLDSLDKNKTPDDNNGSYQIDNNNKKAFQLDKLSHNSSFSLHLDLLDSSEENKKSEVIINDNYTIDKDEKIKELNESSFSLGLGLRDNLEIQLEKNRTRNDDKTKSLKLNKSPRDSLERKLEKSKNHLDITKNEQKPQLDELSSSSMILGFGLRESVEKNGSIIIIDESLDNIKTPKKSPQMLPRNAFVSLRKKNKETTEVIAKTPDLSIKNVSSLLDSIYGKKWRANQNEVLLSLSEPKKKQPKPKNIEKKVEVPKTERALKPKIKGNLLPAKKLNFERLKKPVMSPFMKQLKGLVDSESSSEEDNLKKTTDIRSSKVRLDFNDASPIPIIKKRFGGIKNKENNPNGARKGDSKKGSSSATFSEDDYQVSTDEEYDKEIQILETTRKSLMPQKKKSYSFLESLSGTVPLNKCDMSARIFRSNFKQHREELTTRLFKIFNEKVFSNALPPDTELEWNDKLRKTAGLCYCRKITHKNKRVERKARIALSSKVLDSADRLRDTLVHEMCHAVTWIVNEVSDGHGAYWKNWAFKAMKIFPELPAISRCHNYAINSKYTYRCTKCGYSFGRHSKSLDVERKRCGHCYGKFEVLINKTTKNGETKAVPVGEKKTNGFALFVKENYANYKDPSKKHGDVMKILGQKFAELKVKN